MHAILQIAQSAGKSTIVHQVEDRVWTKWEPFVETVNAALAQPRPLQVLHTQRYCFAMSEVLTLCRERAMLGTEFE